MITETTGDLLTAEVDALVNAVNTHGVMGKGLALQFKRAYPAMFDAYRAAATAGAISLGSVHVWPTGQPCPRYVINFPTKGHWRSASRLTDIESGLADLASVVRERSISSLALPPLGCGLGGLDWADVRPLIFAAFAALPEVRVVLFVPGPGR